MWAIQDNILIICFLIVGLIPVSFYILKARLKNILYREAFLRLGLVPSSNHGNFISNFQIGTSFMFNAKHIYHGTYKTMPVWFVYFEVPVDDQTTKQYSGVILQTPSLHETVQIYDIKSEFAPIFSFPKNLESVEFDKSFNVYAPESKNAYYQLSPSAMQVLLDHKTKYDKPLNIQYYDNKFLVYSEDHLTISESINPIEIFSQKPSEWHVKTLMNNISFIMADYYDLYQKIKN